MTPEKKPCSLRSGSDNRRSFPLTGIRSRVLLCHSSENIPMGCALHPLSLRSSHCACVKWNRERTPENPSSDPHPTLRFKALTLWHDSQNPVSRRPIELRATLSKNPPLTSGLRGGKQWRDLFRGFMTTFCHETYTQCVNRIMNLYQIGIFIQQKYNLSPGRQDGEM